MVKIYFGCAMRPGRENVSEAELAELVKAIEGLGHELASKHTVQRGIVEAERKSLNTAIHDRDYAWLRESEAGIFEISNPSLGVGAEISDLLHLGKPVLCLFKKGFEKNVSGYVQGKQGSKFVGPRIECRSYLGREEAKAAIAKFLESGAKD